MGYFAQWDATVSPLVHLSNMCQFFRGDLGTERPHSRREPHLIRYQGTRSPVSFHGIRFSRPLYDRSISGSRFSTRQAERHLFRVLPERSLSRQKLVSGTFTGNMAPRKLLSSSTTWQSNVKDEGLAIVNVDMAVLVLLRCSSTLRVVWMAERTMRGRDEKKKKKTYWKARVERLISVDSILILCLFAYSFVLFISFNVAILNFLLQRFLSSKVCSAYITRYFYCWHTFSMWGMSIFLPFRCESFFLQESSLIF